MPEIIFTSLFWFLSLVAMGFMFLKFRDAQRVLENADPAAHFNDLNGRIKIAQEELARLEVARQAIEPTKIELEQLQLRRQAMLDEISALEGQRQNLLQELQRLEPEKQQLENLRQQLAKVFEELADARQKHSEVLKETEVLKAVLAGLQQTRDTVGREITDLEARLSQLRQQQVTREAEAEARLLELRQQIASLESESAACAKRVQESRQDYEKAVRELKAAQTEKATALAAREKAYADLKEFEAKTEALRKAMVTYEAMVKALQADVASRSGTEAVDPNKALEDLAQPALNIVFTGAAKMDEPAALRRVASYLEAKGLKFPDRVQTAFHTSLKSSQINPLVVLAGVSGTGKSALPMAYAEALGINSVSLAVQPGWSGPQDLLGFYNYLERKYKATELARAMAQMSRFSTEDLPGLKVKSRKDEMLLLLLDEMNLARIEYYFSDFLSRLEQRRGKDPANPQHRRDVALRLEIGSLPANEVPRLIFPDTNVLFVGTMNEDESTQSLSDKVVDRANVLRFGAPKSLHAVDHQHQAVQAGEYLPRSTWDSWLQKPQSGDLDAQRKLLSEINAQLERINRPFGHRVFRAALEYIANYPGVKGSNERLDYAMADQIEQKIIPKLRGLDNQEEAVSRCLDFLSTKIAGLRDAELREAFDRARSGHMFEWFGVKRS